MKQTLDSSSQQHSTHPSFRRPKPAAGLETLWKTPPTPAPLWHARLPLTQAPTVHQGELRGDLQDTNQSGWPSGRAQPAGTRAGSPQGMRPGVLSAQLPGRFLSTCGPSRKRSPPRLATPQRTSQTSNPAAPALQRAEKRQGDQPVSAGHPLLSSLPTSETARSQPALGCRSPFSQPTTHQSPNCPPVPIPLPLGVLILYVKWRQDRGGNSSQPITHRFSELLCQ